ncbi:uncharacterized protein LAESUDRAFT_725627 [Laetiporus sulphureus 93-53]|uniref:Uncharacterized protein n=1 Tax=Laetiporus sulphureus 93-53 TaxID=1314785 RepID=A0A165EEF2_9APHY|nr:uncharacterized protein LAESUDRAFT_725627 [Laetiporus sulphureus 93-53]KZT06874.1 hypothetical protein LAESUDRAFT_725627 [Laetiporus sulphureus 93-53]
MPNDTPALDPTMTSSTKNYVVQVTQTWRGKDSDGKVFPLHWALTIITSDIGDEPSGNIYNAAGNIDTYYFDQHNDVPLRDANWRGDLPIGTIRQADLADAERILADVEITRHHTNWNCQNWVWASIRALRRGGYAVQMFTREQLIEKMDKLLDDWESGEI